MDDLISRQQVLSYIDRIMTQGTGKNKSFDFIRKYVENMPSAQLTQSNTSNTSNTLKSLDCIDRQAAIDKVDSLYRDAKNDECYMITGYNHALSDMRAILNALPSAQPETHDKRTETHACDLIDRQAAIDAIDILKRNYPSSCFEDLCKAVDIAIKALSAQTEQRWIPCSERLPEDDTEVLVYLFDRPSPYIAWVTDCCWFTEDFQVEKENYPTAWMPLPELYREEGEENV